MDLHANAVLTVRQRQRVFDLVAAGLTITAAALTVGCSRQTASKWVNRRRRGESLQDRSSRPRHSPRRTPEAVEQAILRARAELREGPHVIGWALGVAASTVHAVLRRHGRSRLVLRTPPEQSVRYERSSPGELVHVDIKKLGRIGRVGHRIHGDPRTRVRGIGWEFVHVAIDDATRLAYVEVLADESGAACTGFVWRARAWFRRHGIRVRRILSDNGPGYRSRRFTRLCRSAGLRHLRTRPYTPRTNGKAERFIQTLLREWAYRRPYPSSRQRTDALPAWLHYYNWARGHGAHQGRPPISRLVAPDNLVAVHS